jgi:hypothetical protein
MGAPSSASAGSVGSATAASSSSASTSGGLAPCTDGVLWFNPHGPGAASLGEAVRANGSATCGGTPEYEFWMQSMDTGTWTIVQPYGPSSTYVWHTYGIANGNYDFRVWVRNQGSTADWETSQELIFPMTGGPEPCGTFGWTTTPGPPALVGTTVTFAIDEADCAATPEYQFDVWAPTGAQPTVVQPWGASSTFNWDTSGLLPGTYDIGIEGRVPGTPGEFALWSSYLLSNGPLCTILALSADPESLSMPGPTVTLTGAVACAGTPQYEFWMKPPGGAQTLVQPYSTTSTYPWDTTGLAAGSYDFTVYVKAVGSATDPDATGTLTYTLPPAGCGNGTIDPGEDCDGTLNVGSATCASVLGDTSQVGQVRCTQGCKFDTGACAPMPSCAPVGATWSVPVTGQVCQRYDEGSAGCSTPTCSPIMGTNTLTVGYAASVGWFISVSSTGGQGNDVGTYPIFAVYGPTSFVAEGFPSAMCTGVNPQITGMARINIDCGLGDAEVVAGCEYVQQNKFCNQTQVTLGGANP